MPVMGDRSCLSAFGKKENGGIKMNDKRVKKLKKKVRALDYWQRIELMDWMNTWYAAMKEEAQRDDDDNQD
jgi:hypothetical protein